MLNKFNFKERMTLRIMVNTVLILVLLLVVSIGFFVNESNTTYYFYGAVIVAFLAVMIDFNLSSWASGAIRKPIMEANEFTTKASKAIKMAGSKHESSISRQLELIKETEEMVKKLSVKSEETKQSAQRVADKSNEALHMSKKGQESMDVNIRNMTTLKQKIETIAEQILELSEHTQQIGSIIGVVEDITEQTNMLALNAAVEAARAGEHGRGFAVVASEIRKLADQCKQATTKISALIYDIQQATNSTVMATEEGTKEIEAGVNLAKDVAETINGLITTICETVESVEGIVSASKEQLRCANDVTDVMISVNAGMNDSVETIEKGLNAIVMLEKVTGSLYGICELEGDSSN